MQNSETDRSPGVFFRWFVRPIITYLVVLIVCLGFTPVLWLFMACGLIRVKGYWRLLREVFHGRLIIAARHPTLLETFIIPFLFAPFALFLPRQLFVWSMPDKHLFNEHVAWFLSNFAHCILVSRDGDNNRRAIEKQKLVLRSNATVVVHPEAGRTLSEPRGAKKPHKRYGRNGERYIRRIVSQVPGIARDTDARVLPIYIDVPFMEDVDDWRGFWVWIKGRHTITFSVGEAFRFPERLPMPKSARLHLDNKLLGQSILEA